MSSPGTPLTTAFGEMPLERGRAGDVQLIERLYQAIDRGTVEVGFRLPTIRAVAQCFSIPRSVVQVAYKRLAEAGIVQATVGRGTEVVAPDRVAAPTPESPDGVSPRGASVLEVLRSLGEAMPGRTGGQEVANFRELLPDRDQFPVDDFASSLRDVLEERGPALLGYGDPQGDPDLRSWLASRGEHDPDELLITNGAQQGIDLVLRALTAPGDTVATQVPTYSQLSGCLAVHSLQLAVTPWRTDGVDIEALDSLFAKRPVRLLYVMSSFQNPTGYTLTLAERERLVEVCRRRDVAILEDDFEGGLRFEGVERALLGNLAPERTATVRTFSKGLFPGIRLGWVRAPRPWLQAMTALRRFTDLETSPLMQAAVLEFGRRGHIDEHMARVRAELKTRHMQAHRSLEQHMPRGVTWSRPEGGLALWIDLADTSCGRGRVNAEEVARQAAARGVLVTPGVAFDPEHRRGEGLRLCLSQTPPDVIERGIAILGELLHGALMPDAGRTAPLVL